MATKAQKDANSDPRNVEVEALRDHSNSHGEKFEKKTGDKYVHPRPAGDILAKVVKLVDTEAATKTK